MFRLGPINGQDPGKSMSFIKVGRVLRDGFIGKVGRVLRGGWSIILDMLKLMRHRVQKSNKKIKKLYRTYAIKGYLTLILYLT